MQAAATAGGCEVENRNGPGPLGEQVPERR